MKLIGLGLNLAFLVLLFLLVLLVARVSIRETRGGREIAPIRPARVTEETHNRSYPLKATTVIGRDPGCDLVLDDDFCSGEHAAIIWDDGRWLVRDLGSTNGTLVNGSRVRETIVRTNDKITVGRSVLTFEE